MLTDPAPHVRHGRRALTLALALLAGCEDDSGRSPAARAFPVADRPIAPVVSTRWSDEQSRDRMDEARLVMDRAGIAPGMTVADIGAGEGYYTVRLAKRVGAQGRVLAEDIMPEVIEALGRRVTRENWANVSLRLGTAEDPKLPAASFDRVFMVHMYHEITEPYAFLWNLRPALRPGGEVIVVDANRPTARHGTPPALLECEFGTVGYKLIELVENSPKGGYFARFRADGPRPAPGDIVPCRIAGPPPAPDDYGDHE